MTMSSAVPMRWGDSDSSEDEDEIKVSDLKPQQPPTSPDEQQQKRNNDSLQALSSRKLVKNNPFLNNDSNARSKSMSQFGGASFTPERKIDHSQSVRVQSHGGSPQTANRNFRGAHQGQGQQKPQDWKSMAKSASKFGAGKFLWAFLSIATTTPFSHLTRLTRDLVY